MVDNNPAILFMKDGDSKGDYISIVTTNHEFYEGLVIKAYSQLLLQDATSQELTIGTSSLKLSSDYPAFQKQLMKSIEYAGFARVFKLARGCGVELILLDEAQHIQDRGQLPTQYMVGDWLKGMADEIGVPTVLLGLPRVDSLLRVNEQLRRRFTRRLCMNLGQNEGSSIETECF